MVVCSSQLDKRGLRKLNNRVKRERLILEKAILKFEGKRFAFQADAEMALEDFKKRALFGLICRSWFS